jgi:ABC-type glutathione transport system ATPase component
MADVLQVSELTVAHPVGHKRGRRTTFVAVNRVSLRVGEKETVGLVGESGSGKTTVALAVTGLGPRTSGAVTLLGTPIGRKVPRAMRPDVQVVFQDPHASLDPRQSVRAGLAELRGLQAGRTDWIGDAELLGLVGLPAELLRRYPHQLSGGQAQRVCIARALLPRPKLLVADEPTSGLDVSVQAQILTLLAHLQAEFGFSVLFISHDLGVVRGVCDRVYVMLRGRVVEEGPAREVLDHPQHEYTRRLVNAVPGRALREAGV